MSAPRLLLLDIETAPAEVYTFQTRNVNIGIEQIKHPGHMLAVGSKWLGEKDVRYRDVWPIKDSRTRRAMLQGIREEMEAADGIITFNGDRFDIQKINGEYALAKMRPVRPFASIDVRKTTSSMGYTSGRLAHIAEIIGCRRKHKHDGFSLWAGYMAGDAAARTEMRVYCKQDVQVLEDVYLHFRAFIKSPPALGDPGSCPTCYSDDVTITKHTRRTPCFKIVQHQCNDCGHWFDGTRSRIR